MVNIIGHPSISDFFLNLVNSQDKNKIELAARLYTLLERLNIDPTGKNTPWINVCEIKEFKNKAFIFHVFFRAKIIPYLGSSSDIYFRVIFICDQDLKCNVYFFLGHRDYSSNTMSLIRKRYWEFNTVLRQNYLSGEIPLWRCS